MSKLQNAAASKAGTHGLRLSGGGSSFRSSLKPDGGGRRNEAAKFSARDPAAKRRQAP